jgi:hypothetical protein
MTPADARKILLSMPEAGEKSHMGHPDFRVGDKIFATLWPKESRAVVKLPIADQTALVQMSPKIFSLAGWAHQGWTNVHLKHISKTRFRALAETAWRLVAPKALVRQFDTNE